MKLIKQEHDQFQACFKTKFVRYVKWSSASPITANHYCLYITMGRTVKLIYKGLGKPKFRNLYILSIWSIIRMIYAGIGATIGVIAVLFYHFFWESLLCSLDKKWYFDVFQLSGMISLTLSIFGLIKLIQIIL